MNYKLKTTYIDVLFHSRVYFVNFKICSKWPPFSCTQNAALFMKLSETLNSVSEETSLVKVSTTIFSSSTVFGFFSSTFFSATSQNQKSRGFRSGLDGGQGKSVLLLMTLPENFSDKKMLTSHHSSFSGNIRQCLYVSWSVWLEFNLLF